MDGHGWRDAPYDASRYGSTHKRLRREWASTVATGRVTCPRCMELIRPGQRWHLGHRDDGKGYSGPEHEGCNLSAASAKAHAVRWARDPQPQPRTRW
jgi:hypothetical protein